MNKIKYLSHDAAKKEAMKDWRYRFWYYLLWPKYRILRWWYSRNPEDWVDAEDVFKRLGHE